MTRLYLASLLLVALPAFMGCAGGSAEGPRTVKASGVVTLDGVPVEKAQVVFIDDANQYPAFSPTDAQGKFSLRLSEDKMGAVPGPYKVQVTKTLLETGNGAEVSIIHGLPEKYSKFPTSGLTFTIPDSGTSDIKLELQLK